MERNFLFDLAGVLIKWETTRLYDEIFAGNKSAIAIFFESVLTEERLSEISKGRPSSEVLHELKLANPDYARALDAWVLDWDRMVTGPIEGSVDIARDLRQHGFSTYILGNWSREEFDRARARFPFLDEFHGAVISGDHGVMKPSPAIFQIATRSLGLVPRETLFIDDTLRNVDAAKKLGFKAVQFTNPRALRKTLTERGFLPRI